MGICCWLSVRPACNKADNRRHPPKSLASTSKWRLPHLEQLHVFSEEKRGLLALMICSVRVTLDPIGRRYTLNVPTIDVERIRVSSAVELNELFSALFTPLLFNFNGMRLSP
jgi:hypothetical protein